MAGIYLHIPFCAQRCVYCDFYFVTTQREYEPFARALLAEIEYYGSQYGRREPVETVYFGGGTPSRLPLEEVARIAGALHQNFDLTGVRETTFEVNPDDLTLEYLSGLRALGIDRLSVGIQSFFPDDLSFMGRAHTAAQAEEALDLIRRAGFDNFSADLIFGIPDQPAEHWGANLERLVRAGVPHLSTYGLTVEERTPLFKMVERGRIRPADEEQVAERYRFTMDFLRSRGYEHYEISSFARPGFRAVHNQRYWEHRNYLGFGPSAHSFWSERLSAASSFRWSNVRNLKQYETLLAQHRLPLEQKEPLSLDALADEYVLLRLRTSDGLSLETLESRYGVDLLTDRIEELAWLESEGLIHPIRNDLVRLTDEGRLVCDAITSRLVES